MNEDRPTSEADSFDQTGQAGSDAPTPLQGFMSGGLAGFLTAFEAEVTRDDSVEDPEALRLAEEAVAAGGPMPAGPGAPIDGAWAVVARQTGTLIVGLDEVARTLEAEGVPIGWDPYDPRESVAFLPPGIGTGPKTYALIVPESQLSRSREILEDVAPQGVTYSWDSGSGPETPEASAPGGPLLSDNERLQRLASGGAPGVGIALAIGGGLFVIGIVFFMLMRG